MKGFGGINKQHNIYCIYGAQDRTFLRTFAGRKKGGNKLFVKY